MAEPTCSFCGIDRSLARKMIAGKSGDMICEKCAKTAARQLAQALAREASGAAAVCPVLRLVPGK